MKSKLHMFFAAAILVLAFGIGGCSTTSSSSKAEDTEALLMQSGFKIVPAGTPAQLQQVQSLHPGKIAPVQRHGQTYYVYPDSTKRQLFVGTESQYQAYRSALSAEHRKIMDAAIANSHPMASVQEQQALRDGTANVNLWERTGWGPWNVSE